MAEVAAVLCLHQCIRESCGGDPLMGDGCRFDIPKKAMNGHSCSSHGGERQSNGATHPSLQNE